MTVHPPPVIVAAAPTGAWKSRDDHPNLPVSIDDIAEEACHCMEAGAAMLHLHVRDDAGRHSLDAGLYHRAIEAVHSRCGDRLLIQATSEQAGVYDTAAQIAAIRALDAKFISIALCEVIGEGGEMELERAARLFDDLKSRGTCVQLILYAADHLARLENLRSSHLLGGEPMPLLFVLGRYHKTRESTPDDLSPFLETPPDPDPWMVCAFGSRELECMRFAAARGGHVRVGFENNVLRPDGSRFESTAESVALTVDALKDDGHAIADADTARRVLLQSASAA